MKTRFALVDVNNFYVSCERLFQPELQHVPVVVLSNSDGCVVARDQFCKAIPIPMGAPWHQIQDLVRKHGIRHRSSNYELYGDLSRRVHRVIGSFVPEEDQEIYSVDESFLDLTRHPTVDGETLGRAIKTKVYQWCGVPVCVGIGATKTLAKFANHLAKKREQFKGVCDLTVMPTHDFQDITSTVEVKEVWGIGRKLTERLNAMDIRNVQQLMQADPKRLRDCFGVVVERTVRELHGIACSGLEVVEPRQQIISSRSFGAPVFELEELRESVAEYIATATYKLRQQESKAGTVRVWLETNRFRTQDAQYHPCAGINLPNPSDDIAILTKASSQVLERIYRKGFRYVKAGVMLEDLGSKDVVQGGLFGEVESSPKRQALLSTLDRIHERFGRHEVGVGHAGVKIARRWSMKRGALSNAYTTRWDELLEVS